MTRRIGLGLACLAALATAGCNTDAATTRPSDGHDSPGIGLSAADISGTSCSAADVYDGIVLFMTAVTPNENSAANGKWNDVTTALAAGDYTAARAAADVLTNFLEGRFQNAINQGRVSPNEILDGSGEKTYAEYLELLTAAINCFVGRFDVIQGNSETNLGIEGEGGVSFPVGFCVPGEPYYCPGITVTLTPIPPQNWCNDYDNATHQFIIVDGCVPPPLNTPLDQSGISYFSIETDPRICGPDEEPSGTPPSCYKPPEGIPLPTVAICYDGPEEKITGYRVGHQQTDDTSPAGFSVREFTDIPTGLQVITDCDDDVDYDDIYDFLNSSSPQASSFGALTGRLANFLLPERLQAQGALAFGGVGGSAEEFSPFGAVYGSADAFGGVGGSAEEFAPPVEASAGAQPMATPSISGSTLTEAAGAGNWTGAGLPYVIVQTRGLDGVADPLQDVTVRFTVVPTSDPDNTPTFTAANLNDPVRYPAKVCNQTDTDESGYPYFEGATGADGKLQLPCLNFGTRAGYAKLKATFDVSSAILDNDEVEVLAAECDMVNGVLVCRDYLNLPPNSTVNWLLLTTAGPATQLIRVNPPTSSEPLQGDFNSNVLTGSDNPTVRATDAYLNPIEAATVKWTANSVKITGTTGCLNDVNSGVTSDQDVTCSTAASGETSIVFWQLGPGENTLTATLPGTSPLAYVDFTAYGRFDRSVVNACVTGTGQKDALFSNGVSGPYYFIINNVAGLLSVDLFLSTNGAPGSGEKFVLTLTTSSKGKTYAASRELGASPNVNKDQKSTFLFSGAGSVSGNLTFNLTAKLKRADGVLVNLPANVTINSNTGICQPGKTCTVQAVAGTTCNTLEKKSTDNRFQRLGFPAWLSAPVAPSP